ncbi:hypothetical protein COW83_00805, partial [Candidatus Collierbacteria bacterium CG22_combo_CG10-13_8_21_14_all_43_12]
SGYSSSGVGGHFESSSGYALITSGGNVGIGTATPAQKLHVRGQLRFDGSENEEFTFIKVVQASDYIEAYSASDASAVGINYFISTRASKMDFQPLDTFVDSNKIYDLDLLAYNYKADAPGTPKTIGLIADDTANILPVITAFDSTGQPHHVRLELLGVLNTDQLQKIRKGLMVDDAGNVGIKMTNPSVTLDVTGDIEYTGTITDVSDARLKENFAPIYNSLDKILSLDAYRFNMIGQDVTKIELGYKAQNVQSIFPELVSIVDPENGYLGVNYIGFIPVITEAIQEQQLQISSLSGQLADLSLTDSGDVVLTGNSPDTYVVATSTGITDKIGAFFKIVSANIIAGVANINNLTADVLKVNQQLISPIANIDTINSENINVATISAKSINSDTIKTITADITNATVSGTLLAGLINTDTITAKSLSATNIDATSARITALEVGIAQLESVKATTAEIVNATVSGTLYANNIYDFENKIATSLQQPGLLDLL